MKPPEPAQNRDSTDEHGANAEWRELVAIARLNEGPLGTFVSAHGREFAVFRAVGGQEYVVIDNACPHAHGNLAGGCVTDGVVECPWHQWQFSLKDGACVHNPAVKVQKHPCREQNGVLYVSLPNAPPPPFPPLKLP